MFERIPAELRALKQWVVWKYENVEGLSKLTKVPYQPNGWKASVTDPKTWSSFEECLKVVARYSGLGLVFSRADPYSFIDLDDTNGNQIDQERQIKIYNEFDSYSEISPGGKGLHIIVKGSVPQGRRRAHIEIYSDSRYATFTGNVYNDKLIEDRQELLTNLWEQMGGNENSNIIYNQDQPEVYTDEEIINQARNATNAEKFIKLYEGQWQEVYPEIAAAGRGPSEADFALINMLGFYTKNVNQITRLFHASALGKRTKAHRVDYVSKMIQRSFDKDLPPVDFSAFTSARVAQSVEPVPHKNLDVGSIPTPSTITYPPGLLGEIAHFIYAAAPRPVHEIAIAGAIGLMAGICGRAYNVSGTGLNQYVMLIAATGTGKEAMASGIDRLMDEVRSQVPTSSGFIGPSEIASGQALVKHLAKSSQCFVSILGEFGLRLQQMSSQHANSAEIGLRRMLLDLYNKSGKGQVARPSIYADRDKNTDAILSPSFSILGESTPERFYGALNEEMISEGLLPRFMLIEYTGERPPLSNSHAKVGLSFTLANNFPYLVANCESIMHGKRAIDVVSSPEALALTDNFDKYADDQINGTSKEVVRQLWNRAHIKVLKMAALIAVGVNPAAPVILPEYAVWAINMVQNDIKVLSGKFDAGEIGKNTNEIAQVALLRKLLKDYYTSELTAKSYDKFKNYHLHKIIPHSYLAIRLGMYAQFYNNPHGRTKAIKQAVAILLDYGTITRVDPSQFKKLGLGYCEAYILTDTTILI